MDTEASTSDEHKTAVAQMDIEGSDAHGIKTLSQPQILVKIVSAEYGPCEVTDDIPSRVAYTRDVAPLLRALLLHKYDSTRQTETDVEQAPTIFCVSGVTRSGMKRSTIPILGTGNAVDEMTNAISRGMNVLFGDPCPGITKSLRISYITSEKTGNKEEEVWKEWAAAAQIHHLTFAEHEKVLLHHKQSSSEEQPNLNVSLLHHAPAQTKSPAHGPIQRRNDQWGFQTGVSEVVLPLVMGYLSITERVHARIVCRDWRRIIQDWGVATVIDRNDPQLLGFTRPFLIGLLKHSYSSLQSLFLSGFKDLQKEDLGCIRHLRKLRCLDVSRCIHLDDSTLSLLADNCSDTLEVLYIKGLRKVTDAGMLTVCKKCARLRVLDVSNVPITDVAGVSIGRRLINLKAFYTRDNFRLTTESVTAITSHCFDLEQLTLWGCTKLEKLQFATECREKLCLLNLWGCHSLRDDAAASLEGMTFLRTLIVSECHCLTDAFFVSRILNVKSQSRYSVTNINPRLCCACRRR